MPTNTPMTLSAYAASRGLNQGSISRAIKQGKLTQSVGRTEKGMPCITDPELADREWAATTQTQFTPTKYVGAPKPILTPSEPLPAPIPPRESAPGEPTEDDLAKGNALGLWYGSELKRVKLEELEGTLVLAADVEREWADVLATVRTKLLGLPTAVRQACPHLTPGDIEAIDKEVRAALEDLAGEKDATT